MKPNTPLTLIMLCLPLLFLGMVVSTVTLTSRGQALPTNAATLSWKSYGGTNQESARLFIPLHDSAWIMAGVTKLDALRERSLFVKVDAQGEVLSQFSPTGYGVRFGGFYAFSPAGYLVHAENMNDSSINISRLSPDLERSLDQRAYSQMSPIQSLAISADGDTYFVSNSEGSSLQNPGATLTKLRPDATRAWQVTLPQNAANPLQNNSKIAIAADGDALISAKRSSDTLLVRISPDRQVVWTRSVWQSDGLAAPVASRIIRAPRGFIVSGHSSGNIDVRALYIDESGETIWDRIIGGAGTDYVEALATNNVGFVFSMRSTSPADGVARSAPRFAAGSQFDRWVVLLDATGRTIAEASFSQVGYIEDLVPRTSSSYFAPSLPPFYTADYDLGILELTIPPIISQSPQDVSAVRGQSVSLTASALSTDPAALLYQWKKNGIPINAATNQSLTISNLGDSANYSAVVSNQFGSAETDAATVQALDVKLSFQLEPSPMVRAEGVHGRYVLQQTSGWPAMWNTIADFELSGEPITNVLPSITDDRGFFRAVVRE